jgi:hypothetical protein
MAVDIEPCCSESLPADPASLGSRVQQIYDAVQAVEQAGINPVIYSSQGNWLTIAGDTHPSFGCLPLWTPVPDLVADLGSDYGNPWQGFGGWSPPRAGKQYCLDLNNIPCSLSASIGAPDADLDIFNASVFSGGTWGMALDETDANIGANVVVSKGGFRPNHATHEFLQTVTITNTSTSSSIPGPVSLALDDLSANATLVGPDGASSCTVPAGSFFVNVPLSTSGSLAPGQSAIATLAFTNSTSQAITYTPRVLAGSGAR